MYWYKYIYIYISIEPDFRPVYFINKSQLQATLILWPSPSTCEVKSRGEVEMTLGVFFLTSRPLEHIPHEAHYAKTCHLESLTNITYKY